MDSLGTEPDLTVGQSIDRLHRVFVTCATCARRNQLSYGELRLSRARTWRGVFASMRCRQGERPCGERAAKLEVIGGPPALPRPILTLYR